MTAHPIACDLDDDCSCPPRSRGFVMGAADLFGRAPIVGFGDGDVEVRAIEKSIADDLIRRGHYSGSVVWSSSVHLGVFWNGSLCGALQFGPPMNPAAASKVVADTPAGGCLELNRMWLDESKPDNCASRAISFALKYIRRVRPAVAWVQSFADERCGKLGAVYQACSFLYLGSHETTFYELDGEWFHQSMMGRAEYDKRGWWSGPKIARLNANKDRAIPHVFRQYRYVRVLKRAALKSLRLPVAPYPKPALEAA